MIMIFLNFVKLINVRNAIQLLTPSIIICIEMKKQIVVNKVIIILSASFLLGCGNVGPKTIMRDRFNYTTVLSDSWKEQMLLNIVRLRYGDAPIFLDVASVINSYEVTGRAELGANVGMVPSYNSNANGFINSSYSNRPTITYTPLSGERFAKSLMMPIPISPILSLIQSGYPANLVFRIMVQSINGLDNRYPGKDKNNPEFYSFVNILTELQDEGAIGLRLEKTENSNELIWEFKKTQDKKILLKIREFKELLGLDKDQNEFNVSYGIIQSNNKEIVILTRSMLQVLKELSYYIDVPLKDVEENRTSPSYSNVMIEGETVPPLVTINYSNEGQTEDTFVEVPYRKRWFSIDDKDLRTKQIFSFLMFTFTLVETGSKGESPLITIPVR